MKNFLVKNNDEAIARLIAIEVMWSEWEYSVKDQAKYKNVIDQLLSAGLVSGQAYMHECHTGDNSKTRWTRDEMEAAVYELPPKYGCGWPEKWLKASDWHAMGKPFPLPDAHTSVASGVSDVAAHNVEQWGDMFCTRIFMDSSCYRAAIEVEDSLNYWVLVDMRFQEVREGPVLWHTSLSFWSHLPLSGHHRPPGISPAPAKNLSADYADKLIEKWNQSRPAFRGLVRATAGKTAQEPRTWRVFDRSYQPPSFVVAVPRRHHNKKATTSAEIYARADILLQMSNMMLFTQNYNALPHALLKGGVSAFRRFIPAEDRDAPRYLLIPDTQARVNNKEYIGKWHEVQEEATAIGAYILTNLEAYAASELDRIYSGMRITENHLEIYQGVAVEAGTLWDALARLLPDARSRRLDTVHRSIEMVHQTLLQGVGDLDELARKINEVLSRVESTVDDVADRFHRQLEHPSANNSGQALHDSLRGGYFDRLRLQFREASAAMSRVSASYRLLLENIGRAFDERRVRESDRLQRPAFSVALAFGVLGLAGVAAATLPLHDSSGPIARIVQIFLWTLTFAAVIWVLSRLLPLRSLGRVITPGFEPRFEKVRDFLSLASTDHLEEFRRSQQARDLDGHPASWPKIDKELCGKFADAWDAISEPNKRGRIAKVWDAMRGTPDKGRVTPELNLYNAEALRSRVETWTLLSLMLTERPRDFTRYRLPRLTCLYRICTKKTLRDWQTAENMPHTASAVCNAELEKVLPSDEYGEVYKNLLANESVLIKRGTKQLCDDLWNDDLWNALRTGKELHLE